MTINDALAVVRVLDALAWPFHLDADDAAARAEILARERELTPPMGLRKAMVVARAEWILRRVTELSAAADTPDAAS